MEPRWKANCQRQWRRHHQDLGVAIWRLPVDPDRALGRVSFSTKFSLLVSVDSCTDFSQIQCQLGGVESRWKAVDSCPDFSQFQGHVSCVEPRWKANCQWQCRRNHEDLGLAIWRLQVDADRPLGPVSFSLFFSLSFC